MDCGCRHQWNGIILAEVKDGTADHNERVKRANLLSLGLCDVVMTTTMPILFEGDLVHGSLVLQAYIPCTTF